MPWMRDKLLAFLGLLDSFTTGHAVLALPSDDNYIASPKYLPGQGQIMDRRFVGMKTPADGSYMQFAAYQTREFLVGFYRLTLILTVTFVAASIFINLLFFANSKCVTLGTGK